jgi:hypothetical protein
MANTINIYNNCSNFNNNNKPNGFWKFILKIIKLLKGLD